MDWKRYAKKQLVPFNNAKDFITKIQENGFVEGSVKKLKEDFIKDMPIIGNVYDLGKTEGRQDGKKEGFAEASKTYEEKLLTQAEEFLKQSELFMQSKEEKDMLLDEYEKYIRELEGKLESLTEQQQIILYKLKDMQNRILMVR